MLVLCSLRQSSFVQDHVCIHTGASFGVYGSNLSMLQRQRSRLLHLNCSISKLTQVRPFLTFSPCAPPIPHLDVFERLWSQILLHHYQKLQFLEVVEIIRATRHQVKMSLRTSLGFDCCQQLLALSPNQNQQRHFR